MKRIIQSILSMIFCAMIVATGVGTCTVHAAAKTPFTVAFQEKTVTLAKDVFGDIYITPKALEQKWGKPKKTIEGSDTSYIWKKGETSIRYSVNTEAFTTILINIKDKNGEFLGVKVGMKKATVLKKLKKVLGVTEADVIQNDNEEVLRLPLSGVIPSIGFIDGKVSYINYCSYIVEEPVKTVQDTKPVISSSQAKIKKNSCTATQGKKVKLTAKSGKTNITKKGNWKSSKKSVATISKTGVLSAKKAGTTYITITYKGKTSAKLKVVVKKVSSTETDSKSDTTPGTYTITYNKNSKEDGIRLSGKTTQKVSGEILEFDATIISKKKKFIGWYTKKTGGTRIFETYVPTKDMTLYAHYTDKDVQQVSFVLGCNYGDTYSFMSGRSNSVTHYRDFDWLKQEDYSGPMAYDDSGNVVWEHNYSVTDDKSAFLVDDMPVPSVPGYEFVGWYTTPQERFTSENINKMKIDQGSSVLLNETMFYARFTKKLTVSFDDLRGGTYDDIVIDSYKSITDSGEKLPVPKIPGATFLGWTMDPDNNSKNWSMPIVTNETMFLNCIEWYGFMCSGCGNVSKHWQNKIAYDEPGCDTLFSSVNDDYHVFEETDHFTLYPVYKYHSVDLSFDPRGGYFPFQYDPRHPNRYLVYTDGINKWDYNHKSVGVYPNGIGSQPYGYSIFPGHESDVGANQGCWHYGCNRKEMPLVERNHYVFDKWVYLDENGNEVDFTYDTILTENMTVYAKWNPGTCFVSYDATDGTITQAERDRIGLNIMSRYSVTTESTIASDQKQMPIPVSSEGRTFEGWYTEDGERVDENTQILDDTTLYAHWSKRS